MAKVYSIKNWQRIYEVSDAKRSGPGKALPWVAIPTKHDGRGFRRLMRRPDGVEIFGAFILMVEIAARCQTRGILADEDGAFTVLDLADKTGTKTQYFEKALEVLSSTELGINWLEVSEDTQHYHLVDPPTDGRTDRTDVTDNECYEAAARPSSQPEAEEVESPASGAVFIEFPCVAGKMSRGLKFALTQTQVDEWADVFPGLDVPAAMRKALGWLNANQSRRKTAKGMPRFLFQWLERAQNRGECRQRESDVEPEPCGFVRRTPTEEEYAEMFKEEP